MHFATLSTTLLALASTVLAAPASSDKSYAIRIQGIPKSYRNNDTAYLAYGPNFFGTDALLVAVEKDAAIRFNILPNGDLNSTTGQTIALEPLSSPSANASQATYTNYTGAEGTYLGGKFGKKVLNYAEDFSSWLVCGSQYGYSVGWATSEYNVTAANEGYPFPCFLVKFHTEH